MAGGQVTHGGPGAHGGGQAHMGEGQARMPRRRRRGVWTCGRVVCGRGTCSEAGGSRHQGCPGGKMWLSSAPLTLPDQESRVEGRTDQSTGAIRPPTL